MVLHPQYSVHLKTHHFRVESSWQLSAPACVRGVPTVPTTELPFAPRTGGTNDPRTPRRGIPRLLTKPVRGGAELLRFP